MTIIASGLWGLTEEKFRRGTVVDMESETAVKALLATDTFAPNFDTMDFRNDVTNEVSGTGYTSGGITCTTTELTVGSPAAGQMKYDIDDLQWPSSTITAAMCDVGYGNIGTSATDPLLWLQDFITAVSTVAGLLLVQIAANGVFYEDYTP